MKVIHIVLDHIGWRWDAEAIQLQHPSLTLGQIHSALAYYYDHREELDRQIKERQQLEQQLIAEVDKSPLQQRLRQLKQSLGESA